MVKGEYYKIRRGNLNGTTINVKNDYASKAHSARGNIDNDRHTQNAQSLNGRKRQDGKTYSKTSYQNQSVRGSVGICMTD